MGISRIGEKQRKAGYKDVFFNYEGWANPNKYLPMEFDLVFVKLRDNPNTYAWINGKNWEGLRLKDDDIVIGWKRKIEDE